jgi:hypothetical protein
MSELPGGVLWFLPVEANWNEDPFLRLESISQFIEHTALSPARTTVKHYHRRISQCFKNVTRFFPWDYLPADEITPDGLDKSLAKLFNGGQYPSVVRESPRLISVRCQVLPYRRRGNRLAKVILRKVPKDGDDRRRLTDYKDVGKSHKVFSGGHAVRPALDE